MTTFIYGLFCPVKNEIRYIGKSNNPSERLRDHLACNLNNTKKENWIKFLRLRGLKPTLIILEAVADCEWKQKEKEYIKYYFSIGNKLVNGTEGGDGGALIGEAKERMIKALTGRKWKKRIFVSSGPFTERHKLNITKGRTGVKVKDSSNILAANMKRAKPVLQFDLNNNFLQEYNCTKEASRLSGAWNGSLVNCCIGKQKTAGGFIWKYKTAI